MNVKTNIENKEVQKWNNGRKAKAIFMASILPLVPVVSSFLFKGCDNGTKPNDNGTEKPVEVDREFTIESTFFKIVSGVNTPFQGKINIKDETGGSESLKEQGIIEKFQTAFDTLGVRSETNVTIGPVFYQLFPRNVTIIVDNAQAFYYGFRAVNHNTARAHITFLSDGPIVAGELREVLNNLADMMARAKPANDVRLAKDSAEQQLQRYDGQQKRNNMLAKMGQKGRVYGV